MYWASEKEIFHVHTWRCKHASDEPDDRYIKHAIVLGAKRIVFTDHCPFPDNPFRSRMDMEQLPEYISTLSQLKEEYASVIDIQIGLEAEYLPSFHKYYEELKNTKGLDLLVLGQHMYEHEDGSWSFSDKDMSNEYIGLCDAIIEGIKTGYFDVVAHPDRSFRRCKEWTMDMERLSGEMIREAMLNNVLLEKNYSSMRNEKYYWSQFWTQEASANSLYGYDAHSVDEMDAIWNMRM